MSLRQCLIVFFVGRRPRWRAGGSAHGGAGAVTPNSMLLVDEYAEQSDPIHAAAP
ncbi:hypothetical protein [Actinoplanes sp. NBRC 101535]|uniref:hypothetical protein n=1 Tax=Actinoplanes sp. NBRC 101535 TaxID=3032196 RepID=UPI00255227AC|nr:hypothetical protein [Actinoplanes sp. NBRC 101535]